MAQFFTTLGQTDKANEQASFNNIEDNTVQYVISPDKAQFPTQQIVVTSGEQLMVVDGQSQQIVIEQPAVAYQGQRIQQTQVQQTLPEVLQQQQQSPTQVQIQNPQFAVIQDGGVSNGTQQIFFMEGSSATLEQQVVQQAQTSQQPIVLNHQIGQGNTLARPLTRAVAPAQLLTTVRGAVRQPLVQQQRGQIRVGIRQPGNNQIRQMNPSQNAIRPPTAQQQQQIRQTNPTQAQLRAPNQGQIRQTLQQQQLIRQGSPLPRQVPQVQFRPTQNINQQIRQTISNQIVRTTTAGQVRMTNQVNQALHRMPSTVQKAANAGNPRSTNITSMLQQQKIINSTSDDSDSMEEQETLAMPDGNVMTVAAYKKLLADPKSRASLTKSSTTTNVAHPSKPSAAGSKRKTVTPRPRAPPKKADAARVATSNPGIQLPVQQQQQQQVVNDPSRYAMMNQQHITNNTPSANFQNQQPVQQNQLLMQQQPQHIKPSQANYVIQPPRQNQKPQLKRPLPSYIPSSQIQKIIENTPISEEFSDSIRMLVLLENGEQRLITFTLPKEACTIQEILEQVNVPFQKNTNIQVTEANSNGINYIVTVGNMPPLGYDEDDSSTHSESLSCPPPPVPPVTLTQMAPQETPNSSLNESQVPDSPCSNSQNQLEETKSSSPEPTKEILPKLMPGMLALCGACGYLSEDFAKCIRCLRKLPDNVKAIQATLRDAAKGQKKPMPILQQSPQQFLPSTSTPLPQCKPPIVGKIASPTKKKPTKTKVVEQESVVISSDEEGDTEKSSELSTNLIQKLGASITISPITKEPSLTEIQRHNADLPSEPQLPDTERNLLSVSLKFRTIRVGSYRCIPPEKVIFDSEQVVMKVPHPDKLKGVKIITFEKSDVVKVLASFNPALPVIFYYLNQNASKNIRDRLDMTADGDYYYDPISVVDESFRRITFLPDEISDEEEKSLKLICGPLLEELNAKEANDILIKTCPKEVARASLGLGGAFTEIKTLLQYPPEGRGRITINTEDYVCLAQDQFLNDVIIDFYLKYLVDHLPVERRSKVHVFSTFFYKRLTTKPTKASRKSQPAELDPTLTPAQKRHARVKTWTKSVNLFEKDFIIVPINENAHWFLAIICFPGMDGCETWDGKPYKLQVKSRKKKKPIVEPAPSVSVTPIKQEKVDPPIVCEDPVLSDKDEAEGDDSELESDDSEELPLSQGSNPATPIPPASSTPDEATPAPPIPKTKIEPRPAIKQPCILIFDSLAGANRSRVVATLRDYLTWEHKAKLGKEKNYNKDVIKGCNPKVPQQNNFTDCGLYVLQYVEQFFKDPIKDYNMPIKQIQNWFEEIIVTKKREDIAILIKTLMREYGKDINLLPDIIFPTINGKLIEHDFDDEEEEEEDELPEDEEEDEEFMHHHSDEEFDEKDESMLLSDSIASKSASSLELCSDEASPIKPSVTNSDDFVVQPALNPKPDLSEFPRQTNKDTLSILKAKRIIRHKTNGPEMKKLKSD